MNCQLLLMRMPDCRSKRQWLCCIYRRGWLARTQESPLTKNMVVAVGRAVPRIFLFKWLVSYIVRLTYRFLFNESPKVLLLYGILWFWFPFYLLSLSVSQLHSISICTVHVWNSLFPLPRACCCFICFACLCCCYLFCPSSFVFQQWTNTFMTITIFFFISYILYLH